MIYIGNVFTGNFMKTNNWTARSAEISWTEFDEFKNKEHINFFGHEDVAKMVGMEMNRISISVDSGDIIVLAQYNGPRLPEGCTKLPEGAKITPVKIEVL